MNEKIPARKRKFVQAPFLDQLSKKHEKIQASKSFAFLLQLLFAPQKSLFQFHFENHQNLNRS